MNLKKILKNSNALAVGLILILGLTSNLIGLTAFAQNSGLNTSNLIIGKTETSTSIELSVCIQATPGPLNLGNVSTWFEFDSTLLSTTTNTFLEKGQYGNGNNGYGLLKWQEVLGSQNGTLKTYTMRLDYSDLTSGAGLLMSTNKELYGKVSFVKSIATENPAVNLTKNQFFTTQNPNIPIVQQIAYVNGDCRSTPPNQTAVSNGGGVIVINNVSTNSIVKPKIQNDSIAIDKAVIQKVDPIPIRETTTPQSIIITNNSPEQTKIQNQSDYQSVRTGGLNSLLIFIMITVAFTSVMITIKSNYRYSSFNK